MNKAKWTPGPWKAIEDGSILGPEENEHVAFARHWRFVGNTEIAEANANLISAAPDMAEALENIVIGFDSCGPMLLQEDVEKARAALQKARGESGEGQA